MSRYMNNDTSNCTEIWAGTAFYQDCFDQTVCLRQTDGVYEFFKHGNDTYKKVLVAGYVMAGFFAGFIFIIFLFSST